MKPWRGSPQLLCITIAVILLAGCRNKSDETSPPTSPVASPAVETSQPQHDSRPVIVAFGDSLTAGYGTDAGNSYPDFLERDLNAQGYHYRVVNAGISGNTTKDGVARVDEVIELKPDVVIVAFGGNDGLRGLPIDSTRSNLDHIVSTLQHAGAKVVLGGITLPPNYGPDYVREFNQTYVLLARRYHVSLLPFLLQGVYGAPGSMQPDGIHATAQGNAQVARNLLPLVSSLLHRN